MKSWLLLFFVLLILPFVASEPCQENQQRQCGTTDIGACSYGAQSCQSGQWSICYGSIDPVTEICANNLDDDCDGETDEACLCIPDTQQACSGNTQGICQPGYQTCINGTQWSSCFNQTFPLASDLCNNNIDDDCDGQVDEGCTLQNQTPQTTPCFNNAQDGDETGVDCGGNCRTCTTCTDSILNQGEYKAAVDLGAGNISDCGGSNCPVCPTCSDGIQNQGEEAVDCGRPCQICQQQGEDADADQDGLTLTMELQKGTDPTRKDSDGDGQNDKQDKYPLCPNTVCDVNYGENGGNCPEDCQTSSITSLKFTLLILFVLLVVIGGYFWYQFKRSTNTLTSKKAADQDKPMYIDKGLLETKSSKEQKTKIDKDLEKSFAKAEKLFK